MTVRRPAPSRLPPPLRRASHKHPPRGSELHSRPAATCPPVGNAIPSHSGPKRGSESLDFARDKLHSRPPRQRSEDGSAPSGLRHFRSRRGASPAGPRPSRRRATGLARFESSPDAPHRDARNLMGAHITRTAPRWRREASPPQSGGASGRMLTLGRLDIVQMRITASPAQRPPGPIFKGCGNGVRR
jgi:hypothetical protein